MKTRGKVAIVGSGNIGTDLLFKIHHRSKLLDVAAMVGIDPSSEGLAKADALGVVTLHNGVEGLVQHRSFSDIDIVIDATSAQAHKENAILLEPYNKRVIDLTPAALGPFVVPSVNLNAHKDSPNINMVTCGGQATVPIVAAINQVSPVLYAEIVASISSQSAGPGTRANIDEFTETTAQALEVIGGAQRGKAIIILNPAKPPTLMRDTVLCLVGDVADTDAISESVKSMVESVAKYVPGYKLHQEVQFRAVEDPRVLETLMPNQPIPSSAKIVTVFLEVKGAGDYLPEYAGNLDVMTSAAVQVAEQIHVLERAA